MKKLYDVTIYRVLHCPVTPGVNLVSGPLILHKYFNDMQSSIQSRTKSGADPAMKSTRTLMCSQRLSRFKSLLSIGENGEVKNIKSKKQVIWSAGEHFVK